MIDLGGTGGADIGVLTMLPSDATYLTDGKREWIRSGIVAKASAYPGVPSYLHHQPKKYWVTATTEFTDTDFDPDWSSLVFGNGLFLVTSEKTTDIYNTSVDGVKWVKRKLPSVGSWDTAVYGGGKFVVIGSSNTVYVSTDGINWTAGTLPTASRWRLAYGNGMFVAVTVNGVAAMSSPDGITWTARTMPSDLAWDNVFYGNGMFIALNSSTTYATSINGTSWTSRTLPFAATFGTFADGRFVIGIVNVSYVLTSLDGVSWTKNELPYSATWTTITYGNGFYVMSATSGKVLQSKDAIAWVALPSLQLTVRNLEFGMNMFVAIQNNAGTSLVGILIDEPTIGAPTYDPTIYLRVK